MPFGDFARLDDYDPDGGFKDTFRERFGAAPLSAEEAAAMRQRQFRNRPPEASQETIDRAAGVMSDVLIPKTPLDVAITAATLPVGGPLARPVVRAGMLALGGILNPDAAEAGPISKAIGTVLAPLRGKPGGPWEGGIRAYHSSPHDFEKVDFSKLRTGEGANVYGAGHYMAENPAVSGQGGQYWGQFLRHTSLPKHELEAAQILRNNNFDRATAIQEVEGLVKHYDDKYSRDMLKVLQSDKPVGPRTYEMNLRAKPEELLDWDKPLSQQSAHVRERLPEIVKQDEMYRGRYPNSPMADPFGSNIYTQLGATGKLRIPEAQLQASEVLRERGIPGIRYLDEGSRISSPDQIKAIRDNIAHREALLADRPGDPTNTKWLAEYRDMLKRAENPTYNYVGVDPSKLDILAKYGVGGALPLGALASQDDYRQ